MTARTPEAVAALHEAARIVEDTRSACGVDVVALAESIRALAGGPDPLAQAREIVKRLVQCRSEYPDGRVEHERMMSEREYRALRRARAALDREREEARANLAALAEVRQRGCDCGDEDACRFLRERDAAYLAGWRDGREAAAKFAETHRVSVSNLPPYLPVRPNEPPMQKPTEVEQAFADAIRALPEPDPCTPTDS